MMQAEEAVSRIKVNSDNYKAGEWVDINLGLTFSAKNESRQDRHGRLVSSAKKLAH